jgi:hypothetical protein
MACILDARTGLAKRRRDRHRREREPGDEQPVLSAHPQRMHASPRQPIFDHRNRDTCPAGLFQSNHEQHRLPRQGLLIQLIWRRLCAEWRGRVRHALERFGDQYLVLPSAFRPFRPFDQQPEP